MCQEQPRRYRGARAGRCAHGSRNLAGPKDAPPASGLPASNGLCIHSFRKQNSTISLCFVLKERKEVLPFLHGINHDCIFPLHFQGRLIFMGQLNEQTSNWLGGPTRHLRMLSCAPGLKQVWLLPRATGTSPLERQFPLHAPTSKITLGWRKVIDNFLLLLLLLPG